MEVREAAGEAPKAVVSFSDHEDPAVLKGGRSNCNFRGRVAFVLVKEVSDSFTFGTRAVSQHLRSYLAYFFVPPDLTAVIREGQASLGDRLQQPPPFESLGFNRA